MPRWCHRVYAAVFGYFWTPCPLCGRMFGGHEAGGTVWVRGTLFERTGRLTCSRCAGSFVPLGYDGFRTDLDVDLEDWSY